MRVFDVEIPTEAFERAEARMKAATFTAEDIRETVAPTLRPRDRVSPGFLVRLAQRLIKLRREAGDIAHTGTTWRWIGTDEP